MRLSTGKRRDSGKGAAINPIRDTKISRAEPVFSIYHLLATVKDPPIEVKYQTSIYKSDTKGLARFCDVQGCDKAFLVTKDKEGTMDIGDIEITLVPLWRLLLQT